MSLQTRATTRTSVVTVVVGALVAGLLLVAAPAQAQRIRPAFWGMHDGDWTSPPSVPIGSANLTTAGTYWPQVQKRRHRFDWSRLDAQVDAAEAVRAQPMLVLGRTPRFASPRPRSAEHDTYSPRIKPWRTYVRKVARRYGDRLDYQIWPEPNIIQNWKSSPRRMAVLTVVASKTLRRHARGAKVVAPALAIRLREQQRWTLDYFRQRVGGKRVHHYVDAIAIDPFPLERGTPEDSRALIGQTRRQLARIGVRKPLWSNEINYGVAGGGEPTRTRFRVDKQQAYVIRTFALSADAGIRRTYWLGWFRRGTMAVHMTGRGGRPRPPAHAYELVRSWLNRTAFRGCRKSRAGLWTCTARRGGEVRRIHWKQGGGRVAIRTPRSTTRVQNQEGRVNDRRGARRIRVDFRPIMVASRR